MNDIPSKRGGRAPSLLTMHFPDSVRQIDLGQDLIVYADEQGSPNRAAGQNFAVGYFFEPVPRVHEVVAAALAKGSADLRAVIRGYFHASKDCGRSRALLADAIRNDAGDVFFTSLRWDFRAASATQPHKGELHRHALALALNRVTQRKAVRRVELRFAHAQGLGEESLARWFAEDVDVRLRLLESLPGLPMCFPEIVAREVEGSEPGIQVADHLLWRERRAGATDGDTLEDVGLSLDYELEPDKAFATAHYCRQGTALAQPGVRPPHRVATRLGHRECLELLAEIERFVHRMASVRPANLTHLMRILEPASSATRGKFEIGEEHVDGLCRAFLVAVDTLPGYDVADHDQSQAASDAAALAANLLRKRESWSVTLLDSWLDMRSAQFRDPEHARYLFAEDTS
jgi:hypothetical protein